MTWQFKNLFNYFRAINVCFHSFGYCTWVSMKYTISPKLRRYEPDVILRQICSLNLRRLTVCSHFGDHLFTGTWAGRSVLVRSLYIYVSECTWHVTQIIYHISITPVLWRQQEYVFLPLNTGRHLCRGFYF